MTQVRATLLISWTIFRCSACSTNVLDDRVGECEIYVVILERRRRASHEDGQDGIAGH